MIVSLEKENDIGLIWIDNQPVNAIGNAVRSGLVSVLEQVSNEVDLKAVVLACRGRTFCSGADITEFGKPVKKPILPDVLLKIEALDIPVIAALHGTVFGGGFELALACHYRIAEAHTKLGLPEVTLGLVPGAGGTQRLPRLIGVEPSLEMVTSGKPISAEEAFKLGAVDQVTDGDLIVAALSFANEVKSKTLRMALSKIDLISGEQYSALFKRTRRGLRTRKKGFKTPLFCVDAIEAAVKLPFSDGMAVERKLSLETRSSDESKALRHMFFAERQAAKIPYRDSKHISTRDLSSIGIIGAGTMGSGIALAFLNAGFDVTVVDANDAALERGLNHIKKTIDSSVAKGRLSREDADTQLGTLKTSLSYGALSESDLIIEAVFEDMSVKEAVMRELDQVAKEGAILATNTSYLNVNQIADFTKRPGDVIGLHFFSPANMMKLVEIVRADKTDQDVLQTSIKLAKRLGKTGVVSGVCHGFIGNRMLQGYQRETGLLVLEGASPQQVDKALTNFGMAMGPFAVGDLAGLDIGYMNRQNMGINDYEPKAFLIADRLVEMDRKGQKAGAGWYRYEDGSRAALADPIIDDVIQEIRSEQAIVVREITDSEIITRCMAALVNEGAKILDEGIAYLASDIDVVYVNGYGFPRYKGGPMHYAEHIGLQEMTKNISELAEKFGSRWWTASDYLLSRAHSEEQKW